MTLVEQLAFPGLVAGLAASLALGPASWVAQVGLASAMVALYLNVPILHGLWRYRHIPGPMPLPVLGNIIDLVKGDLHLTYKAWEDKYGQVFKVFVGSTCCVVTSEVEIIRAIGLRKFSVFTNRPDPPDKMMQLMDQRGRAAQKFGILQAKDTYWKGIRSTSHSIFHSVETLSNFCPLMKETADELVDRLAELKEGEVIDIWRAFGDMTLDVIGSTVFGVRFNCVQKKGADAVKAARIVFANFGVFGNNPYIILAGLLPAFFTPVLKALADAFPTKEMKETTWANTFIGDVSDEMYDMAQQGRKDAAAEAPEGTKLADADFSGNSFLKLFVNGHSRETGKVLTKDEVTAQAFIFLLAGYETTANTLAQTIYLMCKNKDKEQVLIEEIDRLGGESAALPLAEELKAYVYVEACVKEALRMVGPATFLSRVTSKDVDVGSLRLLENTPIHMPIHSVHWNPKYFPSPETFLPERFLEGHDLYSKQNQKAFMPFGLGPRMCVAASFAMAEAKLALITLYRKYRFEYNPKHAYVNRMVATLGPANGVEVFVHKR